jgi:hypothetical protein
MPKLTGDIGHFAIGRSLIDILRFAVLELWGKWGWLIHDTSSRSRRQRRLAAFRD